MSSRPTLILASSSPRRRALLSELGLDFLVAAADVDESALPGESPAELVVRLSRSKGRAIAERYPGEAVLAADTVVVLEDEILGKPAGPEQAVEMLTALRGRRHYVYHGGEPAEERRNCGNRAPADGPWWPRACPAATCGSAISRPDEIRDYVATGDPLDKAGAYAIQHPMFSPVERWDGCYTAIMGLPLGRSASC